MAYCSHTLLRRVSFGPLSRRKLGASYRACFSTAIPVGVKSLDELPGPKGWPLLGCLPHLISDFKAGHTQDEQFFTANHIKYGPIYKMDILNKSLVSVAVPEAVPMIKHAEGMYPVRAQEMEENMSWIHAKNKFPPAIIFSTGKEWKRIRSAASKQIVPRRVSTFTSPLNEISVEFADQLAAIASKGGGSIHDIRGESLRFAFQGVSYLVFGEKLAVYEKNQELKEFLIIAQKFISSFDMIGLAPPLYKLFPTKPYRHYVQSTREMHTMGMKIMQRKYNDMKAALERGTVDETKAVGMMEQWLIEGKLTEEEALMLSCDLIAVGTDTTSNTSTFMLHELAKNPEVQDRVFQEIVSVMGDRRSPTFEDIQKMTLLRGCVRETLRLYPPLPTIARTIVQPVDILGYHIPAKTLLLYNMYIAGRNPDYVEDPLAFKPERWDREREIRLNPFLSIAFGVGPRSCYGRRLSELEMYSMLVEVIIRFKLTTPQKKLKTIRETVVKPNEPDTIGLSLR